MKPIVYKKDVYRFLKDFKNFSSFDSEGQKEYLIIEDRARDGQWTLMYYPLDNKWTIHGKGKDYCDEGETALAKNEVETFIYKNRKAVNNILRALKTA